MRELEHSSRKTVQCTVYSAEHCAVSETRALSMHEHEAPLHSAQLSTGKIWKIWKNNDRATTHHNSLHYIALHYLLSVNEIVRSSVLYSTALAKNIPSVNYVCFEKTRETERKVKSFLRPTESGEKRRVNCVLRWLRGGCEPLLLKQCANEITSSKILLLQRR